MESQIPSVAIDRDQVNTWTEFFQDTQYRADKTRFNTYYDEILSIIDTDTKSLFVDYWDIHKFNDEFAEAFLMKPIPMIPNAEKAITNLCPADNSKHIFFRPIHLPEVNILRLKDIEPEMNTTLKSFEVSIRGVKQCRPEMVFAIYRCEKCGFQMGIPQEYMKKKEPYKCFNENCDREATKSSFTLVEDLCEFVSEEQITVEDLRDYKAVEPYKLRVRILNDITKQVRGGHHVLINGIIRIVKYEKTWDYYIEALSIEKRDIDFDDIMISKEELAQITELSRDPTIFYKFIQSIAPGLYGMDDIKGACVLQLFGGIEKDRNLQGERVRGDIHILLFGDPGTGKSQLLQYIATTAPRGLLTSGKSASAAGLTCAAIKDELDGKFIVEGGVLVRSDRGIACIDELDKMDKDETGAMHQALEQQRIDFSKGGIMTTLMTRCSVLAAANPKDGRLGPENIMLQTKLLPSLINRFDLIFVIRDNPGDKEHDEKLSTTILDKHRVLTTKQYYPEEGIDPDLDKQFETDIDPDLMRKYIAHAKKTCFPRLDPEARTLICDHYLTIRGECADENRTYGEVQRVPLTPRQLEGLNRLTEAAARVRLRNTATKQDAELAIRIFNHSMEQVAVDEKGKFDIDILTAGISARQNTTMQQLSDIIFETQQQFKRPAHRDEIIRHASGMGIEERTVDEALKMMKDKGEIYSPKPNTYWSLRK